MSVESYIKNLRRKYHQMKGKKFQKNRESRKRTIRINHRFNVLITMVGDMIKSTGYDIQLIDDLLRIKIMNMFSIIVLKMLKKLEMALRQLIHLMFWMRDHMKKGWKIKTVRVKRKINIPQKNGWKILWNQWKTVPPKQKQDRIQNKQGNIKDDSP